MIPFLDLHRINGRFETALQHAFYDFLASGHYVLGEAVSSFEQAFSGYCKATYCVGVSNGLDALQLIFEGYKILGTLKEGDQVIVAANTYIASVLAISQSGMEPVLVEPDEKTFAINAAEIEKEITPKTRAVLVVHLYGQLAAMEPIRFLAKKYQLLVIEDAAQAHGAIDMNRKKAGSLADAAAFSFYPTKNLGALGDAGAVTTDNGALAMVVSQLRNYGSTRKYHHPVKGYNHRLDELQARFLNLKLPHLDTDNEKRRYIACRYLSEIKNKRIGLPFYDGSKNHVFHLFVIRSKERTQLQQFLFQKGVETLIHYPVPIHKQPAYAAWKQCHFPITEKLHEEVLSLPLHPAMTEEEIKTIITVLNGYT